MQKSLRAAEKHLSDIDPVIARLIQQHGPCTLFDDNSLVHKPRFHVLVWSIINQQLSVASARSIENKLLALHTTDYFERKTIEKHSDQALAGCGISRQKIRYIRSLCAAITDKSLDLNSIHTIDNKQISEILSTLPGIGPWTVDMFLMFALGRLDILPLGDLALRKAFALHYPLPQSPATDDFHAIADRWKPYRSVSSWYLWAAVD